jgi:hypothetical protein
MNVFQVFLYNNNHDAQEIKQKIVEFKCTVSSYFSKLTSWSTAIPFLTPKSGKWSLDNSKKRGSEGPSWKFAKSGSTPSTPTFLTKTGLRTNWRESTKNSMKLDQNGASLKHRSRAGTIIFLFQNSKQDKEQVLWKHPNLRPFCWVLFQWKKFQINQLDQQNSTQRPEPNLQGWGGLCLLREGDPRGYQVDGLQNRQNKIAEKNRRK